MQLLYGVQMAFTIWMMVDCFRRGAPAYWYMMLWVPFGPLVYFFAVKIHDFDLGPLKRWFGVGRPPSIEALRWRLEQTPSATNRLALANALTEAGSALEEAAGLFREVLRRDDGDRGAHLGLARALALAGRRDDALVALSPLLELDANFADGAGRHLLAGLLWDLGRRDEALVEFEQLARGGRMEHRVLHARRLLAAGQTDAARHRLTAALEDYRHAPRFIQRRDARARREGARLLRSLPSRG